MFYLASSLGITQIKTKTFTFSYNNSQFPNSLLRAFFPLSINSTVPLETLSFEPLLRQINSTNREAKICLLELAQGFSFNSANLRRKLLPRSSYNISPSDIYRFILKNNTYSVQSSLKSIKMATAKPVRRLVSCVILDLDGTLLNTEGIVSEVLQIFLVKYGKKWDAKVANKIVGKTPSEAAVDIIEDYGLPCTTDEFISEITPMFSERWCNIKALPGANRLIKHLNAHRVPMALASNSPRENIERKISYHQGWKESFSIILGGDEVRMGKPSPEIFLEAAKSLNIEASKCLVVEDSLPGVTAGKAAGMEVVAVPSIPKQSRLYVSADEVLNSLLDLQPEKWGLPPFQDWIEGTLPIEPWYIGGPVIKGYGRGSKVLGIPTANLSTESYSAILSEYPSGVYFGWAGLSTRGIYKMVMSIGWNPYFNNTEKTIEPWLLHDFEEDFYGEELRLAIVGYIRPELNFSSLESLIEKIHEDRKIAEKALDLPLYVEYKSSPYLISSLQPQH